MLFRSNRLRGAHLNRGIVDTLLPPDGNKGEPTPDPPLPPSPTTSTTPHTTTPPPNPVTTKPPATTPPPTRTPTTQSTVTTTSTPPPTATKPATQPSQISVNTGTNPVTQQSQTQTVNNAFTPPPFAPSVSYVWASDTQKPEPSSTGTALPKTDNHTTIKVIGYAAGGVLGLALIIAGVMFIMRRLSKKREDEALGDVFDRHSFVRDSMAFSGAGHGTDENSHPSERGRPRPPTMIDRHLRNANTTPAPLPDYSGFGAPGAPGVMDNGGYYGNNNGYGNNGAYDQYGNLGYDNYGQQQHFNGYDHQFAAPQPGYYQDSPAQSPIGDSFTDQTAHGAQYLNHQAAEYPQLPPPAAAPGSPTGEVGRSLTRQPSSKVGTGVPEYPNVTELGRGTSVTPFQAAQYAEIGRRLEDPGVPATNESQAYAKLNRQHTNRAHSAYDADDAYGGI